jgi:hypothetical protein
MDRCNANAASALDTRSATEDTRLDASCVGAPTFPADAQRPGESLCAVAAGATTQRTTVAV